MLDRVSISQLKGGDIKVEQKDETGICIAVTVMPTSEWNKLRDKIIASENCPTDFSGSISYLAALWALLEQS